MASSSLKTIHLKQCQRPVSNTDVVAQAEHSLDLHDSSDFSSERENFEVSAEEAIQRPSIETGVMAPASHSLDHLHALDLHDSSDLFSEREHCEDAVEGPLDDLSEEIVELRKKLKSMSSRLRLAAQRIEHLSSEHLEEIRLLEKQHEDELEEKDYWFQQFERSLMEQLRETEHELAHQKNLTAQLRRSIDARNCGVCGLEPRSILFVQCGHLYYCIDCWIIGGTLAIEHGCPICGKDDDGQPRCTAWQRVHHS